MLHDIVYAMQVPPSTGALSSSPDATTTAPSPVTTAPVQSLVGQPPTQTPEASMTSSPAATTTVPSPVTMAPVQSLVGQPPTENADTTIKVTTLSCALVKQMYVTIVVIHAHDSAYIYLVK